MKYINLLLINFFTVLAYSQTKCLDKYVLENLAYANYNLKAKKSRELNDLKALKTLLEISADSNFNFTQMEGKLKNSSIKYKVEYYYQGHDKRIKITDGTYFNYEFAKNDSDGIIIMILDSWYGNVFKNKVGFDFAYLKVLLQKLEFNRNILVDYHLWDYVDIRLRDLQSIDECK